MSDESVRHPGADPAVRQLLDHVIRVAEEQAEVVRHVLDKLAAAELPADETGRAWLDLMATLGMTSSEFRDHVKRVAPKFGLPKGATDRMLAYLLLHVGESVPGEALAGVACIDSWARRLRELRVEHGWPISLPEKSSPLGPAHTDSKPTDRTRGKARPGRSRIAFDAAAAPTASRCRARSECSNSSRPTSAEK